MRITRGPKKKPTPNHAASVHHATQHKTQEIIEISAITVFYPQNNLALEKYFFFEKKSNKSTFPDHTACERYSVIQWS